MKDFTIDSDNNIVKTGHQLTFTSSSIDYVVQKIQIVLRTFLGEYFLDTTIGVDYFGKILIKNPDMDLIGSLLKKQIISVDGVKQITKFTLNYDSSNRELLVVFTVSLTAGQTGSGTVNVLLS